MITIPLNLVQLSTETSYVLRIRLRSNVLITVLGTHLHMYEYMYVGRYRVKCEIVIIFNSKCSRLFLLVLKATNSVHDSCVPVTNSGADGFLGGLDSL